VLKEVDVKSASSLDVERSCLADMNRVSEGTYTCVCGMIIRKLAQSYRAYFVKPSRYLRKCDQVVLRMRGFHFRERKVYFNLQQQY
jgi:hypothetical protein